MSLAGDAAARPPRVSLTNLQSGETAAMPFTPTELVEEFTVKWVRQAVLGMSHETLQYTGTSNYRLPGLEFFFRGTTEREVDAIHHGRLFLMSLGYAPEGGGAPPRILFFWPQVVSMTCVLTELRITHSKFNVQGRTTIFKARFSLEEARNVRLTSETVRTQGTQRSGDAAEESGDASA